MTASVSHRGSNTTSYIHTYPLNTLRDASPE